jgi:site-specific recombinase XerD
MLERYFVRPQTVDRIRASWLAPAIEQYVAWLVERGYAARNVLQRVPLLMRFGEFARAQGATTVEELPAHVDAFVATRVREAGRRGGTAAAPGQATRHARGPVEQLLRLVVPGFAGPGRPRRTDPPFARQAPGFFAALRTERGLRPATLLQYRHHLLAFEAYLARIGVATLADLSPPLLSAFVVERRARGLARMTVRARCGILRVFLRYLHREGLVPADLSRTVEGPQAYRLATVPRAIPWGDVRRVLDAVDRRSGCGQRDYALLLLLVTYGLRAREVAALTLDDLDWKRERLRLPARKAGHAAAFPLSPVVGAALVDYLRHGRPATAERHVFCRAVAPVGPLTAAAVSARAAHSLQRAGVAVPRPGSHTLRHTCAQRLVDADLPFPVIGGYLGHRVPAATAIYTKVAIEALRPVALGDGEEVLA